MWDGRESAPGRAIRDDLMQQARNAVVGHAQGAPPAEAQLVAMVDFELGCSRRKRSDSSRRQSVGAGCARRRAAAGEPAVLVLASTIRWGCVRRCLAHVRRHRRASISKCVHDVSAHGPTPLFSAAVDRARREDFQHPAVCESMPLPASMADPAIRSRRRSRRARAPSVTTLPNAGNHSVPMPLRIGIADASRRTPDVPLFTLRHKATGELVQISDPGRAPRHRTLARCRKVQGPVLRALAARPPYFHDGSAATLVEVLEFYDKRFHIQLSDSEKADLLAFLQAL
jgi:hypothetical protein